MQADGELAHGLHAPGTGAEVALGLAGFCAFLNVYTAQPLLPLLGAAFGASKAAAGLTVSAPNLAVALAAPLVAARAARLPLHRVMVGSLFALVVPTILAATAGSLPALVAWRFAQGLAVPGVYAVGVSYAAAVWPRASMGRAMAALVTGNVLGGFCGRVLAGVVADAAGWRAAFVALGALTLAGAAVTARLLPPARGHAVPEAVRKGRPPAHLLEGALLATFAVGFGVLFTQVATFTYVVFHLAGPRFGLGTSGLSAVFGVYLVGAAVTPVAGRWIGRLGPRRVAAGALAAGLLGTALLLVPWLPAVIAGLALSCSASFVTQSAATSQLPGAAGPARRALASGVYISSYYLGGAVGGVLPAAAWAAAGWAGCVALVALAQVGTLALALRYWSGPGTGAEAGATDAIPPPPAA
jgi:predicted MFS family arabinose efflux permease